LIRWGQVESCLYENVGITNCFYEVFRDIFINHLLLFRHSGCAADQSCCFLLQTCWLHNFIDKRTFSPGKNSFLSHQKIHSFYLLFLSGSPCILFAIPTRKSVYPLNKQLTDKVINFIDHDLIKNSACANSCKTEW